MKAYRKIEEENMKINYENTTIKSTTTTSSMLGEMEKEYREKKRIEERDKAVETCDKKLRKEPGFDCFNAADYGVAYRHVTIERVKIDDPWVIMFWSDKTVTKAKCDELDSFDPEVGIMICICKKLFRTPQNLRKILKNLTKDYYKEFEEDSDITFNGLKENLKDAFEKIGKFKEEADGADNK